MSSETAPRLKPSIGLATTAGFARLLAREADLDAPGRTFADCPRRAHCRDGANPRDY